MRQKKPFELEMDIKKKTITIWKIFAIRLLYLPPSYPHISKKSA